MRVSSGISSVWWVARRSIWAKSSLASGRPMTSSWATRSRRRSSWASMCSSVTSSCRPLDLHAAVGGQLELGLDLEGGRELERLPVGVVRRLDLGPRQRRDPQLLDRLGVELGHRLLLDGLGQQGLAPDPGLDHLPGDLALAEPGHPDLPRQPPGRAVDRRPELVGLHDDVDPHLGGLDGLEGAAHGCLRVGNGLNRAPSSGGCATREGCPPGPGRTRPDHCLNGGQYTRAASTTRPVPGGRWVGGRGLWEGRWAVDRGAVDNRRPPVPASATLPHRGTRYGSGRLRHGH